MRYYITRSLIRTVTQTETIHRNRRKQTTNKNKHVRKNLTKLITKYKILETQTMYVTELMITEVFITDKV